MGPKAEKQQFAVKEHFIFWITKIFYVFAYIVLPMFTVGVVKTIIGYSIAAVVCGFVISIVFQMAHTVEIADFPLPNPSSNKIEHEWAVHQVNTTANFATKNKVISWMVGGLNFQVEHHLFPKISHVYYSKIRPMVKETCKEFNLTYNEYPSFFKAFASHLRHLKKLGAG
jgi:linoleoyl-CoA desaturase